MNKAELITAIMDKTDEYKKSHLAVKVKDELEEIYNGLYPIAAPAAAEAPTPQEPQEQDGNQVKELTDNEKLMLATIPKLDDFSTESYMSAFSFVKKGVSLHDFPKAKSRRIFRKLKAKGFYVTKGKAEGQSRTTFALSEKGIQYLADNGLLAAS